MKFLCPLIAFWMLVGCAASNQVLTPPTKPLLETKLSEPCQQIKQIDSTSYDDWLVWSLDLMGKYGDCAAKHNETVEAWPK